MPALDDETYDAIQDLCAQGDELAEKSKFAEALTKYEAAWDLLPEPKTQWEAATWILGAIGDACFLSDDFAAGRDKLELAMKCPMRSAIRFCIWANVSSSSEISNAPRTSWRAPTWRKEPISSRMPIGSTSTSSRLG